MNPEHVTDTMSIADLMQHNPGCWCICDIVVKSVRRRPAWHGALFHSKLQTATVGIFQKWNEFMLEHNEILIHGKIKVTPDETAYSVHIQ